MTYLDLPFVPAPKRCTSHRHSGTFLPFPFEIWCVSSYARNGHFVAVYLEFQMTCGRRKEELNCLAVMLLKSLPIYRLISLNV